MKKFIPILMLALATLLAFWKVIFHREFTLLAGTDLSTAYFPWFDVAAYWLKRGVFILWDPYVYAGKLSMGEPQPGLYYPLNWLFMLFPARNGGMSPNSLQILMICDYFLASCFFYRLARSLDISPRGAFVAGVAWAYGGFITQLYGYINVLSGFVWLPLTLLYFHQALMSSAWTARLRQLLIAGAFLALAFLPGHHVPPVHIGFLLLVYAIFVAARDWKSTLAFHKVGYLVSLAVVALTAMLLTAHQWLPSAAWARQVYRWIGGGEPLRWGQAVPYSALQNASILKPQDAVSLLLPYISTNMNLYTGCTVLFLALVGILFVQRRESRFFAFAFFLYFFLSCSQLAAVHGWVNTFVPGIWFAREIFYYLILMQACLALLAGWGLDFLLEAYVARPGQTFASFIRRAGWAMAAIVFLSGTGVAILHIQREMPLDHPYLQGVAGLAVYFTALGTLLFLVHTGRIKASTFGGLAIALIVVDLTSHVSQDIRLKNYTGDAETTYLPEYWKKPAAAEFLIDRCRENRFRIDDPENVFPPNFGDTWRLDATMGHGATALVDYFDFRGSGWGPLSNASALLNVRYFVSPTLQPGLNAAFSQGVRVYENPRAAPRAFVAGRYRTFTDRREMLRWIGGPLMAPRETVLLSDQDRRRLEPSFLDQAVNDSEGIQVQVVSMKTAAKAAAEALTDAGKKRQIFIYQFPWGWSPGDEVELLCRPETSLENAFLVLNYFPLGAESAPLKLTLSGPEGKREITGTLPGKPAVGGARASIQVHAVPLGGMTKGEYTLTLKIAEDFQARVDSIRLSRRKPGPSEESGGTVSIMAYEPNRILLSANMTRASFVVVSEVFYPGWEATVDGRPVPLLRADYILRAVPVTQGRHEIQLHFRPTILAWGLLVSVCALGLVLGLVVFLGRRFLPEAARSQISVRGDR
jgi:hypothetical protein